MLSPVIMIGCGGSGSKAVRYVRDAVTRRLREGGWQGPLPDAWSFIGLDTYVKQEDASEIPPLPSQDFLGLSSNLNDYRGLQEVLLEKFKPGTEAYERHLIGWLPHPNGPDVQLQLAAGQIRAVGRAAGLYTLGDEVRGRLLQAFRHAREKAGLGEVSEFLDVPISQEGHGDVPLVVVCASAAGGTGAGVALDMVELTRRTDVLGKFPCLVLFSNDVFGSKVSAAMAGNSLGVMCELMASYWNDRDAGAGDIFSSDVANPGHGPASVFVVGSHGMKGSSIGDSNVAVYRSVGEALSGWVTEPRIQENVQAWVTGNWDLYSKQNIGGYPFGKDRQRGVVSSFGAAVVTVGRTRFERWARDLLCREVLGAVLQGHLRADQLPPSDETLSEFERVDKIAEKYWRVFYGDMTATGEALEADAVVGLAATDNHFLSRVGDVEKWVIEQFERYFENAKMVPSEWLTSLEAAYGRCLEEVEEHARAVSERDKARWGSAVVAHAAAAAADVVAETSFEVAVRCTQQLQAHLQEHAKKLHADASDRVGSAQEERAKALGRLRDARGRVRLDRDSGLVSGAFGASVESLLQEWYFVRGDVVDDLVEAALEGVYGRLRRVLQQAKKAAEHAVGLDETSGWPTGIESIPKQYLPTSIELTLESHSEWGALLRNLCADALRPGTEGRHAVAATRTLLIAGEVDEEQSDTGAEPLVVVDPDRKEWIPGHGVASFVCDASLEGITGKVESWMGAGRFARVVREGIRSYLTPNDGIDSAKADYAKRRETFRDRLTEAANLAKPLVEIDENLHSIVYGGRGDTQGVPQHVVCSLLPFDAQHPSLEDATKILRTNLELCSEDTPSVLVTSFISNPMHPMVVNSLTAPIAKAVKGYRGDSADVQSAFWLWRRSRTLLDFAPVSPDILETLIRGFAVGRLCGYVTATPAKPIRISGRPKIGDDQKEVTFPWPFLSQMKYSSEVLPGLLESLALCFVEVGTAKLDAFEAYRRLYELGDYHSSPEPSLNDLDSILKGHDPPFMTVDTPKAFETETSLDRRKAAIQFLEANISQFEKIEATALTGREYCDQRGYARRNIALREILPTARHCYETVKEDVERIGEIDHEDIA